jgi:glycosyltransferase involved in cell wall biosynthesis
MTTIAVTMVKDEADVIGYTLKMMERQVDGIIVADNMSTDRTREILNEFGEHADVPYLVVEDTEPGYYQSAKMTALAGMAHEVMGADWIVPFDADEVWLAGSRTVAELLEGREEWVVPARLYDHVVTGEDDLSDENPIRRIPWRRNYPGALPKVACRWDDSLVIEMGNHGAHYDFDVATADRLLEIHHFPYRSAEQVLRKTINGGAERPADEPHIHRGPVAQSRLRPDPRVGAGRRVVQGRRRE